MASWVYKWFKTGRDDIETFTDVSARLVLGEVVMPMVPIPIVQTTAPRKKFDQPVSKTLDMASTM
jgi:hypothetical protein